MTPVIFQFHGPDGEPLANHEFVVRLPRSGFVQTEDGLVMPELLTYTTDVDGKLTVELAPSSSPYTVRVVGEDTYTDDCCPSNYINYNFYVPDTAVPVRVQDLVMAPPPSNLPYDEEAIIIITDAKAAALAAQAASEAARDVALAAVGTIDETQQAAEEAAQRAAASELQAGVYKDAAGASATASEASNVQAGLSEVAAKASEVAAGLSESSAAASATSALTNKNLTDAARDAALGARDTALNAADESQASAEASALSATASSNSAIASDASADAAALSQAAAAQSAGEADADRIAAAASAAAALSSQEASEASNVASGNSAASALQYRDAAQASATAADTSNTQAQAAATSASTDAGQVSADKAIVIAARDVTTTARDTTLGYRDTAQTARDEAVAAAATVTGALIDGGYIDLSGGAYPAKPAFSTFWKVTVGGTVSGEAYGIGDTLVYSKPVDIFYKIDNTENVSSVGGFTGAVTLAQLGIDQTYTLAEKTKLGGVATGATANATDADLRDRATHTGSQLSSTISDLAATVRATVLTGLITSSNAIITVSDTILSALGKLQQQVSERLPLIGGVMTGIITMTTQLIPLRLRGSGQGAASTVLLGFFDADGQQDGYVGTASGATRDMYLAADAGNILVLPFLGSTRLYNANALKLTTTTTGVAVTGDVSANTFTGNGAAVTGINATNITAGTLPIARGGTGATTLAGAQTALGIKSFVTQKLADINFTANGAFSLTHTLGFTPQFFTIGYRCKVAEFGYAVGDVIYPQDVKYDSGATALHGLAIQLMNSTTVSGVFTGSNTVVPNKSSTAANTLIFGNWAIELTVGGAE